jgi:hypothetical protein
MNLRGICDNVRAWDGDMVLAPIRNEPQGVEPSVGGGMSDVTVAPTGVARAVPAGVEHYSPESP